MVCGEIINQKYLTITNGEIVLINAESFDQLAQDSLEWVLESEMPAGATVVDQKWTYDETTYRESSDNTLENEGWTQYQDSTTTYGEWGNWSAWSTQSYTKSDTRDVGSKTEQMVASYNMAEFNYMVNGDRVYYKTRQNISNAYGEWNSSRYLNWARSKGPHVYQVIYQLFQSTKVEQRYYNAAHSILKLADKYSDERLESACRYALSLLKRPLYRDIKHILESKDESLKVRALPS